MFFRVKSVGSYQYLQIVHSIRQGEKVRQQLFGTLGRLDELKASGRLEASGERPEIARIAIIIQINIRLPMASAVPIRSGGS
jgi:hypothetical protein